MALNVTLLESSFAAIAPRGHQLTEVFYRNLFADYPAVISLFSGVDMGEQRKKLLASLKLAVENLRRPAVLVPALEAMGARHVDYGAREEHYPAVGATDQHSQMQLYMEGPKDKCLVFVHARSSHGQMPIPFPADLAELASFALLKGHSVGELLDAEFRATRDAVSAAGIPNCTLEIDRVDAYSLGALFYFWEAATAVAGAALGVNAFDQPGVEAAKILTKKYLSGGK